MNGNHKELMKNNQIHVEICQKSTSHVKTDQLESFIMNFLIKIRKSNSLSTNGFFTKFDDEFLNEAVESIIIPEFQAFLEVFFKKTALNLKILFINSSESARFIKFGIPCLSTERNGT